MKPTPIEYFGDWNPYSSPEKCGLVLVDCLDLSETEDSFNYLCVWEEKITGRLYCAYDSGCSCPMPFEDYHKLSQFELIQLGTIERIKEELRENSYVRMEIAQEFLYELRKALKEVKG